MHDTSLNANYVQGKSFGVNNILCVENFLLKYFVDQIEMTRFLKISKGDFVNSYNENESK